MDNLKQYIEARRLMPIKMERAQIEKNIQSAYLDLKEAKATFPVSDKAAYLFAYTAMLKIGRALLFLKGYRPRGEGQHEVVVRAAGSLLGEGFESLTRQFNAMRQKRNKLIYDVGGLVSHEEATEAFKAAENYLSFVRSFMIKQDPQLRLEI